MKYLFFLVLCFPMVVSAVGEVKEVASGGFFDGDDYKKLIEYDILGPDFLGVTGQYPVFPVVINNTQYENDQRRYQHAIDRAKNLRNAKHIYASTCGLVSNVADLYCKGYWNKDFLPTNGFRHSRFQEPFQACWKDYVRRANNFSPDDDISCGNPWEWVTYDPPFEFKWPTKDDPLPIRINSYPIDRFLSGLDAYKTNLAPSNNPIQPIKY